MRVANLDMLTIDGTRETVDLSATANLKPIWIGHIINAGFQLVFTGTPAGNFKLQVSNDRGNPHARLDVETYAEVTHWTDVADSAITISAAGDLAFEAQNLGFEWIRIVWTATGAGSGTPTLTIARAKVKGL